MFKFVNLIGLSAAFSSAAMAQNADVIPGRPEHPEIDVNGISVSEGQYNLDVLDVAVGPKGSNSGISLHRLYPAGYSLASSSTTVNSMLPFGLRQTHNYDIRLYCNIVDQDYANAADGSDPSCGFYSFYVVIGNDNRRFDNTYDGSMDYRSSDKASRGRYYTVSNTDGSSSGKFDFTMADGTVYTFLVNKNGRVYSYKNRCNGDCWFAESVTYPNGERIQLTYEEATVFHPARLQEIISSSGYGLKFSYLHAATELTSVSNYDARALYISSIDAFYQNCSNNPCSRAYKGHVQYSYTNIGDYTSRALLQKVGEDGVVFRYGLTGAGFDDKLSKIYQPNSTTLTSVDLTYVSGKVSELRNANGSKWTYTYQSGYTEVVDPSLVKTTYYLTTVADEPRITQVTDGANLVSKYGYNSLGQITRREKPGGVRWDYTYDAEGNLTSTVVTPRVSSGLSAITTTNTYDACTSGNLKKCHKPTSSVDGEGYRTNYIWSADHGGLLSETRGLNSAGVCALAGGTCPTTSYGYTGYTGIDGALFYRQTSMQEMLDASHSRSTTWEYGPASERFALRSEVKDSGGLALRTCYRFDSIGNLIAKTDAQSGLAACPQL